MLAEKYGALYCEVHTQNPHLVKEVLLHSTVVIWCRVCFLQALNNLVMCIYNKLEKGHLGTGPVSKHTQTQTHAGIHTSTVVK